jgi:beta-N-acetylhexosaminidase
MRHPSRISRVLLAVAFLPFLLPSSLASAQEGLEGEVTRLLAEMSDAAKVGQLFIVTFPGTDLTQESAVAELIRDYHVGGVLLRPENGNIANDSDAPAQVAALVDELQGATWEATRAGTATSRNPYVPLFVAVSHEGNGMPFTSILSGTTPIPSQMAVGATWDPAHAGGVGQVVGRELAAMGVNMLLGPSLDVLEKPAPGGAGDLGVRTFGGEPFWVGRLGKAYIGGVHTGSSGRVAVIAKHFPGLGASDRSLEEEAPTVQRTLDELRQVELQPFFAVAQASSAGERADGLLVSHIRFRGFVATRPASVDSQVLQQLLSQPELAEWRDAGGVMVSDQLGLRALRRFYDPNEQSFNARRIAREAFLAGNDVLLLSQFALTESWEEQLSNIRAAIDFFLQEYRSEPSFRALVDAAVARILRLKLSLYDGRFLLTAVQPDVEAVAEQVGSGQEVWAELGRDAVTLLAPPSGDLVPSPPTVDDDIIIFTDGRVAQPCPDCEPVSYIQPEALKDVMVRLYGADGTGQITGWRVASFTFTQLYDYLEVAPLEATPTPEAGESEETPTPHPVRAIEEALASADWVLFAMLDPTGDLPQSDVVRRFLDEWAGAAGGPTLVVLAFDAPYYLDATEISKLSAYYAAYSHVERFVEMGVQALFGDFAPRGVPPVSLTAINYDLGTQTSPDPGQVISVSIDPAGDGDGSGSEATQLKVGDELSLRTGVIVDRNGNPVPDSTRVVFFLAYPQEGLEQSSEVVTVDGVAQTSITLDRTGQLDISVQADPVPRRTALQITIQEDEPAIITTPTPVPELPEVTPTPTAEPELDGTPEPDGNDGQHVWPPNGVDGTDLVVALAGTLTMASIGFSVIRFRSGSLSRALRAALFSGAAGLVLYAAYGLRVPGSAWLRDVGGVWAAGLVALAGGAVPVAVFLLSERGGSRRGLEEGSSGAPPG